MIGIDVCRRRIKCMCLYLWGYLGLLPFRRKCLGMTYLATRIATSLRCGGDRRLTV